VSGLVLVIEDEKEIRDLVKYNLERAGFKVSAVADGDQGLERLFASRPDALVLDLMLPGKNGLEILREVRNEPATRDLPVIVLTARAAEMDKLLGFEHGADDYLTKPFSPRELLARIRALLRRSQAQATVADAISAVRAYRFGGWELNIGLRKLKSPQGEPVELTNGEFRILTAFLSAPQRVLSRDQLLDLSRVHAAEVYDRSIDIQILRLRRKIEPDPVRPKFIVTQRGAGYVFSAPVDVVR